AFDVTVRNLQRQILRRVPGDATAVGIEFRLIEIVAILIGLAAGENAAFDLDVAPNEAGRSYAECHMRRILPVMAQRRVGIVHRRWAMHECRWTKRRFTGVTEIDVRAQIVLEFLREAEREF